MDRKKNTPSVKELFWVLTEELQSKSLETLFRQNYDSSKFDSERGFLGIVHAGTGAHRRSLFLREIVPQEDGWVGFSGQGLSFSPKYFSRALDRISESPVGAGLIIVHSHWGGDGFTPPDPSKPDLYHERRMLYQVARALPEGSPVVAGILDSSGAWRIREYHWRRPKTAAEASSKKFGVDSCNFLDANGIRRVSESQLTVGRFDKGFEKRLDERTLESSLRLWGHEGQQILGNLRVGISGLGGVGSILVEFLARLGVGELILVDFDDLSDENLNRTVGATRKDLSKPKIRLATRVAKKAATAEPFDVKSFRGSVAEQAGLEELLDADIILNAADSAFARQVLDHISYAYMIPVIDGGTKMIVQTSGGILGKSQVSESGPGQPCLECLGVYTQEEATMAREDPSMLGPGAYVQSGTSKKEEVPRAPSVINYNGLVASLMIQRMLSAVLGLPPQQKYGQQRYYVELGILNWGPTERCKGDCPKQSWTGLGDSHPTPTGVDPIWKRLQEKSAK